MAEGWTIKDLFIIILQRWRAILACVLFFAIVIGGYGLLKNVRSSNSSKDAYEELQQSHEKERTLYEYNRMIIMKRLEQLGNQYATLADYQQNSLLMKIDPYKAEVVDVVFSVYAKPDNQQLNINGDLGTASSLSGQIANRYLFLLVHTPLDVILSEPMLPDIDVKYQREMIKIQALASDIVRIEVYNAFGIDASRVADELYKYAQSQQSAIARGTDEHTLTILSQGEFVINDSELANMQLESNVALQNLKNNIKALNSEILLIGASPEISPYSVNAIFFSCVEWACLGAAAGLFIGIVLISLLEILDGRIRSAKIFNEAGINVLGIIRLKKRGAWFEQWAFRLMGEEPYLSFEQSVALVREGLFQISDKAEPVLVTGTNHGEEAKRVFEALAKPEQDQDDSLPLVYGANINSDISTAKKLREIHAVVLLETMGTSSVSKVFLELKRLKETKKTVIGVVLM